MQAPLLGLEALLDALSGSPLTPEATEYLHGDSRVLARRVSLLIEDLSLVATPEPIQPPMTPSTLDLDQQLAKLQANFPELVISVEGDRRLHVHADPRRVQQIGANLVRNSQRLGGQPVVIRVSGRREDVVVEVADGGPRDGYQMAIVRRLVHAHGGTSVHEPDGRFAFTLPRADRTAGFPVPAP